MGKHILCFSNTLFFMITSCVQRLSFQVPDLNPDDCSPRFKSSLNSLLFVPPLHLFLGQLLSEHRLHHTVFCDWDSNFGFHCRWRNLLLGSGEVAWVHAVCCGVKYWAAAKGWVLWATYRIVERNGWRRETLWRWKDWHLRHTTSKQTWVSIMFGCDDIRGAGLGCYSGWFVKQISVMSDATFRNPHSLLDWTLHRTRIKVSLVMLI